MSNFPALEVVIGLTFVYFVLSLICSAVTESIASMRGWRAAKLELGIKNLLSGSDRVTHEGEVLAKKVYEHPLVQALVRPKTGRRGGKRPPWPSYIPSRTFISALLDIGASQSLGDKAGVDASVVDVDVKNAIAAIPSPKVQEALLALYHDSKGDVESFRRNAERWFDDSMQRVSGWYRRHVSVVLWVVGALVVVFLNVDTLRVANTLWTDPAARAAVVSRADKVAQGNGKLDVTNTVSKIELPLGWKLFKLGGGPQEIPNTATGILAKIIGLVLTIAALSLGAPFWYDLLSRFVRVSGSGPRPPTADQQAAGA
ncbi:MAG: hypothetical protein ACXVRJ_09680 [Gaiellaceae bacterium]